MTIVTEYKETMMIDTIEQQTTCKACGKPLEQATRRGPRPREYCNATCRQRAHRAKEQPNVTNVTMDEKQHLEQRIVQLEQELAEANALLEKKQSKQPSKRGYQDRLTRWGEQLDWPALDIHYAIKPGRKNWRVFMMDESKTLLLWAIIAAERAAESKQS